MKVDGKPYRSIWIDPKDEKAVRIIDQRSLPHAFVVEELRNLKQTLIAIKDMHVRGAPLIGVTAAYGIYLALFEAEGRDCDLSEWIEKAVVNLLATRPTAVNLRWALERQTQAIAKKNSLDEKIRIALETAERIADEDVEACKKIGEHGLGIIQKIAAKKKGKAVNILTHCNAGWLACVDWGTKTAPIYMAAEKGIPVHVWVDETRPRNQGASLTAWEFAHHGIPHTVIVDNAGGLLMQRGQVDIILVGSDRTTRAGDVANKIGTYLKALAAKDNNVPFYVCLPSSTIDWAMKHGLSEIPIEERSPDEIHSIQGMADEGIRKVRLTPKESQAFNPGFDVTPNELVTGLITERGIAEASETGLLKLFPERKV